MCLCDFSPTLTCETGGGDVKSVLLNGAAKPELALQRGLFLRLSEDVRL